jgi:hypothetical protein
VRKQTSRPSLTGVLVEMSGYDGCLCIVCEAMFQITCNYVFRILTAAARAPSMELSRRPADRLP